MSGDGDQRLQVLTEEECLGLPDHVAPCEGIGAEVLLAGERLVAQLRFPRCRAES
ncbi:MAG TPA: hypothetical protein VIV12_19640 [Streptosporangiaceae bacterium]